MKIFLHSPENLRNLGAIIRSSATSGIDTLHVYDSNGILNEDWKEEPGFKKAASGGLTYVTINEIEDPARFLMNHKHRYVTVAHGRRHNNVSYLGLDPVVLESEDSIIAFGSEKAGLPRQVKE